MDRDRTELSRLLRSRHHVIWMPTYEESYALTLVREAAMDQRRRLSIWSASRGVHEGLLEKGEVTPGTTGAAAALRHWTGAEDGAIFVALDVASHLDDPASHRALRDLLRHMGEIGAHLVLIDHADRLPPAIAAHSVRHDLSLPNEAELEKIVVDGLRRANRQSPIRILTRRDGILAVARSLRGLTRSQAERIVYDTVSDDRTFDDSDVESALAQKRRLLGGDGVLESIENPVALDELGGLDNLKAWLRRRSPEAMGDRAGAYGLAPARGVLILGVQGAGKSLCAKAIAAAWRRSLLRLDPGTLYNSYIGASEQRLREALRQAEAMAPIVLWIDEIEKGFASAASRSIDGGLSQRMFGTLLTWMQEHREPVFVTATANDIEALPPELLRKGRFDEIFFVDLPSRAVRKDILAIHLKKRRQQVKAIDLNALADASRGRSGAEIEQAIIAALYDAMEHDRALNTEMIRSALDSSPPLSVTMRERIDSLRAWARTRCVPADSAGPDD